MQKASPEDRLLNLIKGKREKKIDDIPPKPQEKNQFQEALSRRFSKKFLSIKVSVLKPINKILLLVIALLSVYFVYNITISLIQTTGDEPLTRFNENELPEDVSPKPQDTGTPKYSSYVKDIRGKDLFTPPITKSKKRPKEKPIDLTKKFSLVGILAGDEPQAIIEDKETHKTHYLIKGQSLNGIIVEDIGNNKVVLNYGGEKTILVL